MGGIVNRHANAAIDCAVRSLAFAHWFGIPGARAFILSLLYDARGEWIPTEDLAAAARVTKGAIIARVCRLRATMECEAIDSELGVGYRLTEIGIAECRVAILAFKDSLERPGDRHEEAA